MVLYKGQEHRY